jgi:YaiO family outer membrane protein
MKTFNIILSFFLIIGLGRNCLAETLEPVSDTYIESPMPPLVVNNDEPASDSSGESKKTFHLEVGGNYNWLDNNYGRWKGLNLSLNYSGFDKITPSFTIARLTRKEGSQFVYGFGSYIDITSKSYITVGLSGAPVRDPHVILYPRLRIDLGGYYSPSIFDGIVLTIGATHFPKQNGGGGDIISFGGIYYGKIILQGSLSYNIARPGNIDSFSGQAGFMYGAQGRYWIGGGFSRGRQAYELPSEDRPFQVRFRGYGAYAYYNKWIGKDWGINTRVDVGRLVGAYQLVGITTSLFMDF